MPRENVEVVRRVYGALQHAAGTGEFESFLGYIDADAEWVPFLRVADSSGYRGPEGFKSRLMELWEPFDPSVFHADEVVEAPGDQVVVGLRIRGRGKSSGADVAIHLYQVVSLRGGKVTRLEWFGQRDEALEAVGLREQSGRRESAS